MAYRNSDLLQILKVMNFGSSIAENDDLLWNARVETSVFSDLLGDKVDLIPGTKGSGKSALYRIFVDYLPDHLLVQRKVIVAHGIEHYGDSVFQAYNDHFEKMTEEKFVSFWCIYLISVPSR